MKVSTKLVGQELLWCLWDSSVDEKGMGNVALNAEGAPVLYTSREAAEADPLIKEGWVAVRVRVMVEEISLPLKEIG